MSIRQFKCKRCEKYLGEMNKGKIKKDVSLLCDECMKFYETCDSLVQYSKEIKVATSNPFSDLFKNS